MRCRGTAPVRCDAVTPRFACVQLDVPGHLGLDDGRYLLRGGANEEPEAVVVVQTLGGTPAGGRRRQRPRPAAPPDEPPEVPVTRLTVSRPSPRSPIAQRESSSESR